MAFSKSSQSKYSLTNNMLGIAGFVAVLLSILLLDEESVIQSPYLQVIPVIGTVAILHYSASSGSLVSRILSAGPFVYLGVLSYSIYLWHQPVFAFIRYRNDGHMSGPVILLACAGILVLSVLSKNMVEDTFRRSTNKKSDRLFMVVIAGLSIVLMSFAVLGHMNNGYPKRNNLFQRLDVNTGISLACDGVSTLDSLCSTGAEPEVAIFGDSYVMHWVDGFRTTEPSIQFAQLTQAACPPLLGFSRKNAGKRDCLEFTEEVFKTISNQPSIKSVIISSTFETLLEEENVELFEHTLASLIAMGVEINVIGPTPSTGDNFGKCLSKAEIESRFSDCNFERAEIFKSHFQKIDILNEISKNSAVNFIDITDLLCDETKCYVYKNGTIYYRDHGHLSREASKILFPQLGIQINGNRLQSE